MVERKSAVRVLSIGEEAKTEEGPKIWREADVMGTIFKRPFAQPNHTTAIRAAIFPEEALKDKGIEVKQCRFLRAATSEEELLSIPELATRTIYMLAVLSPDGYRSGGRLGLHAVLLIADHTAKTAIHIDPYGYGVDHFDPDAYTLKEAAERPNLKRIMERDLPGYTVCVSKYPYQQDGYSCATWCHAIANHYVKTGEVSENIDLKESERQFFAVIDKYKAGLPPMEVTRIEL